MGVGANGGSPGVRAHDIQIEEGRGRNDIKEKRPIAVGNRALLLYRGGRVIRRGLVRTSRSGPRQGIVGTDPVHFH